MEFHGYSCCMGSDLVLLKLLPLSQISVHAVQTLCMKEGIIIATVNYRYAKIGPCCTKRHRPSLVWTKWKIYLALQR
jgi:hypothetical protein